MDVTVDRAAHPPMPPSTNTGMVELSETWIGVAGAWVEVAEAWVEGQHAIV